MTGKGFRFSVLAVAITGIATLLLFFFSSDSQEPDNDPHPSKLIKAVKPAAAPVAAPVAEPMNDMQETTYKQPDPGFGLRPKKWLPTKEEVAKARLGRDGKPRKKSIYKTPTEQALGQLFSTRLGNHPPMIPNISSLATEKELEKFFSSSFEAPDDASDAVKENRRMMQQVKEELKQFIADGGKIGEFVDYYRGQIQTAYDMWKDAETILIEMAQNGESAINIEAYQTKANEMLAEKNIKPLFLPPNLLGGSTGVYVGGKKKGTVP